MFTGLIETTARITAKSISRGAGKLSLTPAKPFAGLEHGESIAVNGACLTLERELSGGALEFHVLEETLNRTNLGGIKRGGIVNLERAMRLGDRLGGHIVTGHIDAASAVIGLRKLGDDYELRIAAPSELQPYLAPKGSIAVDGISLTLVDVASDSFSVHLIPVTLNETALRERSPGELVNLEADILGKYVRKQLACFADNPGTNITLDKLQQAGWDI